MPIDVEPGRRRRDQQRVGSVGLATDARGEIGPEHGIAAAAEEVSAWGLDALGLPARRPAAGKVVAEHAGFGLRLPGEAALRLEDHRIAGRRGDRDRFPDVGVVLVDRGNHLPGAVVREDQFADARRGHGKGRGGAHPESESEDDHAQQRRQAAKPAGVAPGHHGQANHSRCSPSSPSSHSAAGVRP